MKIPTTYVASTILALLSHATRVKAWWKPSPGTSYQIQLSGTLDLSYDVDVFDVDMFDTPNATITELQERGVKVVCYFSAGTYEDWRDDKDRFTADMIGNALEEWEGESWVDIRSSALRKILVDRMTLAQAKGCDAVDPDNVDGAYNDNGLDLTAADQLDFNTFLATTAHDLDMAVGLKNDLNQIDDLVSVFDFAINEQCAIYDECNMITPFIKAGKPVFGIEYSGDKSEVCAAANALDFDTLFKPMALTSERYACRDYDSASGESSTVSESSSGLEESAGSNAASIGDSTGQSESDADVEEESESTWKTESPSSTGSEVSKSTDFNSTATPSGTGCKRPRNQ